MKVFLNGKFVDEEEASFSLFDAGFLYGQGLFETMRAYNGRIFRIDSHLKRLFNSAPLVDLELDMDRPSLKNNLESSLKKNSLKDAYVRLTLWQGKDRVNTAIFAQGYNFLKREDYEKGFRAVISSYRQNEFSLLSRIKSASYLLLLLAYKEAKKKNADEALLLNTQNFIAEASRANIFLVKDNCLLTPSLDCGCLAGITRDTVFGIAEKEKINIIETRISRKELKKCDEAFLTNSLIEIMPLVNIEGEPLNKGTPGKITELVLRRYRALIDKC